MRKLVSKQNVCLHSVFNKEYIELIEFYKEVFPFIEEFKFYDFDKFQQNAMIPFKTKVFCFKEKNLDNWIPVNDISSGMQKIFLIAQDLFLMPDGGISIIDEYENSLGINAINYFPELILTKNLKSQFFISSHHPYIINNVPIENWLVFNRKGTTVRIKTGKELKTDFGKSKQQQFIKLINDPFYLEGIE